MGITRLWRGKGMEAKELALMAIGREAPDSKGWGERFGPLARSSPSVVNSS